MSSKTERPHLSVVIIGHVDAGKSTTTGHLVYKLGGLNEREMEKLKKEAEAAGKGSFAYAWMFDKLKEERARGITINIALQKFKTPTYDITVIDAPGHRDFIKNMITGTSQADCAILVVSSSPNEFEAGIADNGQTFEHLRLAYTLGIKELIVAVNKMDNIKWKKERFDEIVDTVKRKAKSFGYAPESIAIVPVSGFADHNMTTKYDGAEAAWYKGWEKTNPKDKTKKITGTTLIDAIDTLAVPERPINKPLRIPIQDVYKISGIGTVPAGRVEAGTLKPGMNVVFAPAGVSSEVKAVEMHHESVPQATAGDNVGFNVKNLAQKDIKRGFVCGDVKNDPPQGCISFDAQVIIMNHSGVIMPGYSPVVDCHTAHIACMFEDINRTVAKNKESKTDTNTAAVRSNDVALITLKPSKPMVVEAFTEYPPLGRFAVRDSNKTVAIGVIKAVTKGEAAAAGKAGAAKGAKPAKGKK